MSNQENESNSLQQVGEKIWSTADTLRSVGIKGSEFPLFMMPVFALRMVESRIIRTINEIKANNTDKTPEELREIIIEEFDFNEKYGSNSKIIENDVSLETIVKGSDDVFLSEFEDYLSAYDLETRMLLGTISENDETYDGNNYLNLLNINKKLRAKKIFKSFYTKWAEIDLSVYTNSEITTIEEYIKRKWADISADTAGEHYTPDDIIKLNAAIISNYFKDDGARLLNIYDMTCGGGNMLFGVEDELKRTNPNLEIITYGQEINDELFALAKIESRFRSDSTIVNGNTLTEDKTRGDNGSIKMDGSIANPPYGVDWKDHKETIENDQTGMYVNLPSTSDGQLLFVQHQIFKMSDIGKAVIVLNGSPLFSGDAGSGESEIRKWVLDNDYVEAFVQLPTNEFFNTGITTYLWVLNKNKPESRKNKIMLIDASQMSTKLKKNMATKNCEIDAANRAKIIDMMNDYVETDICKIMDKVDFYYNKQKVTLTHADVNGKSYVPMKNDKVVKSLKIEDIDKFIIEDDEVNKFIHADGVEDLKTFAKEASECFKTLEDGSFSVVKDDVEYGYDVEQESLFRKDLKTQKAEWLGCGEIKIKASYKAPTKTREESYSFFVELSPKTETDYEIIPFSFDVKENEKNIQEFMDKWVDKSYTLEDCRVGVEINFNKIFYKPEVLRPLDVIKKELLDSHNKLSKLMAEVFND